MKKASPREVDTLYRTFLELKSVEECRRFLRDLLTEGEINEFAQRWKAARLLAQGIPYTAIEDHTGLSSRTIARVGRWLKRGKGGYVLMLRRLRGE